MKERTVIAACLAVIATGILGSAFAAPVRKDCCNSSPAALKAVVLKREQDKSPKTKPTIVFDTFQIMEPRPGYDLSANGFFTTRESDELKRNTVTVIPVKTHYFVHHHYDNVTHVDEWEQKFYFYKDQFGDCLARAYEGRLVSKKELPAGSP